MKLSNVPKSVERCGSIGTKVCFAKINGDEVLWEILKIHTKKSLGVCSIFL